MIPKRKAADKAQGRVPPPTPPRREVVFCFKSWTETEKFRLSRCAGTYLAKFIGRLRDLCTWEVAALKANRHEALRFHPISWDRSSEPGGFGLPAHLQDVECFQFGITTNEHGRVHGYVIGHVFHVVWLDPDHLLFPGR